MNASEPQVMTGPIRARILGPVEPVIFPDLADAVGWLLEVLDQYSQVTGHLSQADGQFRSVGVVRVRDAELLLVSSRRAGEGPGQPLVPDTAADRDVAAVLPAYGWHQAQLPEPATPLEILRPLVSSRALNCVLREGYTSVEQIAAIPDSALLDIRIMGPGSIRELRAGVAATLGATPADAGPVTITAAQAGDIARLLDKLGKLARAHDEQALADRAAVLARILPRT